jgi:hypothetical protein
MSHIVTVLTPFIKISAVLSLMEEPMEVLVDLMLLYSLKHSKLLMLLALLTILYKKSLFALLLALSKNNMVPSLVFSINMPIMALVRLFILSPRCVILSPSSFGGKQHLKTLDGYIIPLSICSDLPYMDMSPPTPTDSSYNPICLVRLSLTYAQTLQKPFSC